MKEGQTVHKCNVCNKLGLWDENWSWAFEFKNVYGKSHHLMNGRTTYIT